MPKTSFVKYCKGAILALRQMICKYDDCLGLQQNSLPTFQEFETLKKIHPSPRSMLFPWGTFSEAACYKQPDWLDSCINYSSSTFDLHIRCI